MIELAGAIQDLLVSGGGAWLAIKFQMNAVEKRAKRADTRSKENRSKIEAIFKILKREKAAD